MVRRQVRHLESAPGCAPGGAPPPSSDFLSTEAGIVVRLKASSTHGRAMCRMIGPCFPGSAVSRTRHLSCACA